MKPKEGEEKKKGLDNFKCFICKKKGHLANKCPKKKPLKDANDSSISSKSSKLSKSDELEKNIKKMNKQFTLLKGQEEENSSDDSNEEQLHFQFMNHFSLFN